MEFKSCQREGRLKSSHVHQPEHRCLFLTLNTALTPAPPACGVSETRHMTLSKPQDLGYGFMDSPVGPLMIV